MILEDPTPLTVVVKDGRWEGYGETTSPKAAYLLGYLTGAGGVNESVPNGIHYFNVIPMDNDTLVTSLEPSS